MCIADRMSKVDNRISNCVSAMAADMGLGTVGGCGSDGDGGDGTCVDCVPALRRCRCPFDVASVGTLCLRMKAGVSVGHDKRPFTAACTRVDLVGLHSAI